MTRDIRVGFVGAGENTQLMHIPRLQAISGVTLVGVANRTLESSNRVAEKYGIKRAYRSWAEIVSDDEIDAVVIGTWPDMHCAITVAALEGGKHILCEARMARNAGEARRMFAASRARPDQIAQLVPAPDTLRLDQTIRRLVTDGYFGELLAIDLWEGGSFVAPNRPLSWRENADISGVNAMSLGIWYETIMRWVGEAVRVVAMGRVSVKVRKDAAGCARAIRIPDHLDVAAEMACGAQAHFQISKIAGLARPDEVFLYGSEATGRLSGDRFYCGRQGDDGLTEVHVTPEDEGGWRVEEEFINAIRGLEEVRLTSFQDGVKYMEFTEAVARSVASGQSVALPLLG